MAADAAEAVAITGSFQEAGLKRVRQPQKLTRSSSQLASAVQKQSWMPR